MNERIEELFQKAANRDFPTVVSSIHPNELERFANLIVRECISVSADQGQSLAHQSIKEHFGVEE